MKLPASLGDNMVLQQGLPVPIWGWAPPGQSVTVQCAGQAHRTFAGQDGRWKVRLGPLPYGGPHEMSISGDQTLLLRNLMVGEVWICAGQSNMEWGLCSIANAEVEIREAEHPGIRLFVTDDKVVAQPAEDGLGRWIECRKNKPDHTNAADFSGVGYFFGRKLHQELGVPVGLIMAAAGGVPAESFVSMAGLQHDPDLRYLAERFHTSLARYPEAKAKYDRELAQYEQAAAQTGGQSVSGPRPEMPLGPGNIYLPTGYYNGNIAPLTSLAIRGATFYQGESNWQTAHAARKLYPAIVRDWRKTWNQGDFPFLFVQLANYGTPPAQPQESAWAETREAQAMTLTQPNTGMAITIDIGEADNVHPRNKQDVGLRLALLALANTYGRDVPCSGPLHKLATFEGPRVRLHFTHVAGGLVAKGGPLRHFAVAGADRHFVWADAAVDGDTVVVSSTQVPSPQAVRYAWADNPEGCNLFNQAGLPAAPFRTDDWPGLTFGKR
jgi:sialate O-acetylesterase